MSADFGLTQSWTCRGVISKRLAPRSTVIQFSPEGRILTKPMPLLASAI